MKKKPMSYGEVNVIRPATLDDSMFVYDLRNKPYVRNVSWNDKKITIEEHDKFWKDNYQYYWIIFELSEKQPIGFIRLKNKEVSIAIDKEYWNQSYGYFAIQELLTGKKDIRAEVKLSNEHSLCFFIKSGFVPKGYILRERK